MGIPFCTPDTIQTQTFSLLALITHSATSWQRVMVSFAKLWHCLVYSWYEEVNICMVFALADIFWHLMPQKNIWWFFLRILSLELHESFFKYKSEDMFCHLDNFSVKLLDSYIILMTRELHRNVLKMYNIETSCKK